MLLHETNLAKAARRLESKKPGTDNKPGTDKKPGSDEALAKVPDTSAFTGVRVRQEKSLLTFGNHTTHVFSHTVYL